MLGYGIRYYLMMKCISTLFQKDDDGNTPILHACTRHEQNNVIDVVEETLAQYSPTTSINSTDSILLETTVDHALLLLCPLAVELFCNITSVLPS